MTLLTSFPFQLSLGTKNALSLLPTFDESMLKLPVFMEENEVLWVFRVFYQLMMQPLPREVAVAREVVEGNVREWVETGLEERVLALISRFEFSNENIDKVDRMTQGKLDRTDPCLYSGSCMLASLLLFPIKEALIYSGLVPGKVQPWRQYQRLLYHRKSS